MAVRILSRYLARDFAFGFALTVAIFTLVLVAGTMVRAMDWLARGVPGPLLFRFFALNVPYTLQFSIPLGALTAVLLLFSRLSSDGELTAMRACGMSLWQIAAPVLALAVAATAATLALAHGASPYSRQQQRNIEAQFRQVDPLALIEPGRWIREFPGHLLYVARRDGGRLQDVTLYAIPEDGPRRVIRARDGTVARSADGRELRIDLYAVRMEWVESEEPGGRERRRTMTAEHYPEVFRIDEMFRRRAVRLRPGDHTLPQLLAALRDLPAKHPELDPADLLPQRLQLVIEASSRTALAFTCLAFVLLGIPLGIRTRRRESGIGFGISLGVAMLFYFTMVMVGTMSTHPRLHPQLLVWAPILLAEVAGLVLLHRAR